MKEQPVRHDEIKNTPFSFDVHVYWCTMYLHEKWLYAETKPTPTRIQDYYRRRQHQCSRTSRHRLFPSHRIAGLPVALRLVTDFVPTWHLYISVIASDLYNRVSTIKSFFIACYSHDFSHQTSRRSFWALIMRPITYHSSCHSANAHNPPLSYRSVQSSWFRRAWRSLRPPLRHLIRPILQATAATSACKAVAWLHVRHHCNGIKSLSWNLATKKPVKTCHK